VSATSTSAARCRRALHKHTTHHTKAHSAGTHSKGTHSRCTQREHGKRKRAKTKACPIYMFVVACMHRTTRVGGRHFALARSIVGCIRPPGQRCSLYARTRHDRAHICRGDDGRGTSRSRATVCIRRAAPRGKKDSFMAGTRAPRSGLPRVFVLVLAGMHTGVPDGYCSCTRSVLSTQPATTPRRPCASGSLPVFR
jgi:hypothetical protein